MTRPGAVLALAAGVLLACTSSADQPAVPAAQGAPNGAAETAAPESEEMVAVTGRVVVTGSDPFVILVIVTHTDAEYELVGEQADPLWDLQQLQVTVRGRVVQEASGPGFPAQLHVDSFTVARDPG